MNDDPEAGRWPPVYEWGDLVDTIDRLAREDRLTQDFYRSSYAGTPAFCQGDVISLDTAFVSVNATLTPQAHKISGYWSILSNTCDMNRAVEDVPFWQLVPLIKAGTTDELSSPELKQLRSYGAYREFYYPPWNTHDPTHYLAQFTRPMTISSEAVSAHAEVVARLERRSWFLFHSCLVRYLARDDGRHD